MSMERGKGRLSICCFLMFTAKLLHHTIVPYIKCEYSIGTVPLFGYIDGMIDVGQGNLDGILQMCGT